MSRRLIITAILMLFASTALKTSSLQADLHSSCYGGQTKNCAKLGRAHELKSKKEFDKAVKAYNHGCKHKSASSCFSLGLHYQKLKKKAEATLAFQNACTYGDIAACKNVSQGKKVTVNTKQLLDKSCRSGFHQGCLNLGLIHQREDNFEKARVYYKIVCDQKVNRGCINLGVLFNKYKNYTKARFYFNRSCVNGSKISCIWLKRLNKIQNRTVASEE